MTSRLTLIGTKWCSSWWRLWRPIWKRITHYALGRRLSLILSQLEQDSNPRPFCLLHHHISMACVLVFNRPTLASLSNIFPFFKQHLPTKTCISWLQQDSRSGRHLRPPPLKFFFNFLLIPIFNFRGSPVIQIKFNISLRNLSSTEITILFLKNGPFPASFSLFSSFQYSWQ